MAKNFVTFLMLAFVFVASGEHEVQAQDKAQTQLLDTFGPLLALPLSLLSCQSSTLCLPFAVDTGLLTGALITVQGLTNRVPLLCGNALATGWLHGDLAVNPIKITLKCKAGLLTQGCGVRLFAGNVLGLVIGVTDLLDSTIRVATGLVSAVTGLALPVGVDVKVTAHVKIDGNNWVVDLDVCTDANCQHELGIHVAIDGLLALAAPVWNILLTACRGGIIKSIDIEADAEVGAGLGNKPVIANK